MTGKGLDWRSGLALVALLAVSRLGVVVALGWVLGGAEPSDDVYLHTQFLRRPLALLRGERPEVAQYPPLLPLLEAAAVRPLAGRLDDFHAIRVGFVAWEAAAFAAFCWLLARLRRPDGSRLALAWIALPAGWMTVAVMAEDEVIPTFFLTLALALAAARRPRAALATLGLGVAAGKAFLLVPLAALVVLLEAGSLAGRAAVALGPPALAYGIAWLRPLVERGTLPLAAFSPETAVNVNLWALFPQASLDPRWLKPLAASLVAAAVATVLVRFARGARDRSDPVALATLFAALLVWLLALAYHVNPEYYLMALPALLLAVPARPIHLAGLALLTGLPWLVNVLFGLSMVAAYGGVEAKVALYRLYRASVPVAPAPLHLASLALTIAVNAGYALWLTARAGRAEPGAGTGA
jgi:hypothetical protein